MTANDMMMLRALLEKSSDADLLREMIGFTAERLMAVQVETGAAHGERSPDRFTYRIRREHDEFRRRPRVEEGLLKPGRIRDAGDELKMTTF